MSVPAVKAAVLGTVDGTSAVLVAANLGRRYVRVQNTHASQTLQINLATAAGVAPTAVIGSSHVYLSAAGTAGAVWESHDFRGAAAIIGSGSGTTYALLEY